MTTKTAERQAHREQITQQALVALQRGIDSLVSSDDWQSMLRIAGSLYHRYSFNNMLLIWAQALDRGMGDFDGRISSAKRWRDAGRYPRKGSVALRVWAPMLYKVEDAGTGEAREELRAFKLVPVFDYSQTDGESLPDVDDPKPLQGAGPAGAWDALDGLAVADGWTLKRATPALQPAANGETDMRARTISVHPDLDDAQAVKTLAHEIAHTRMHGNRTRPKGMTRAHAEVEAESVAYVVMHALGLDSAEYTLPYVAGWARGDSAVVQETAERVLATARVMLQDLDGKDE
jgi:hypothetical protein